MPGIHEQKCPNCGAAMRFDPESAMLICNYCDTKLDIKETDSGRGDTPSSAASTPTPAASSAGSFTGSHGQNGDASGFDFKTFHDAVDCPNAEDLPVYACVSCGADLIAPPEQSALTCPYCGNNIVLTDKVSGSLRPNGVIPFKITSDKLPDAVQRFYKDKKLLPKGFFSDSRIGDVTGVYAPFWVFSGKLSGDLTFNGKKMRSRRSGDYIITTTDYYELIRNASISFDDLPVDAGTKIDDRLMDSLEPFNNNEAKPFDMRYLAGFTADRFDEKKQAVSDRAKKRMVNTAIDKITDRAGDGYSGVSYRSGKLNTDLDANYLLFPVYMFNIEHGGTSYPFAVNGQTGKVVGELPISKSVSLSYFFKRFGIISGVLILLTVLTYFLGW